jgi:cytochrome oxidase Cu insertion factor (SCO1/SenC/PrrC family)
MSTETTTPPATHSVHDSPPTRRFWLLMAVSLLGVGAVAYLQFTRVDRARRGMGLSLGEPSRLPVMSELPDFTLTERSGQSLALKDLRGKVWVADFVFTYCGGPCPIMTHRMRQLQDILLRDRMEKVVCVSISVDPKRDTPAVLRDYAAKHSASPTRWQFLTGDEKAIRSLALDGFKRAGRPRRSHPGLLPGAVGRRGGRPPARRSGCGDAEGRTKSPVGRHPIADS